MDETHTFFWLVGVCEGEAYFGYNQKRNSPAIEVEMTDEHVVARIAAMFGVTYSRRDRRADRTNASVSYRVRLTGRRALQIMKRLQPYLSPRRARRIQQIEQSYLEATNTTDSYDRIPLPPLVQLPYIVERQ